MKTHKIRFNLRKSQKHDTVTGKCEAAGEIFSDLLHNAYQKPLKITLCTSTFSCDCTVNRASFKKSMKS